MDGRFDRVVAADTARIPAGCAPEVDAVDRRTRRGGCGAARSATPSGCAGNRASVELGRPRVQFLRHAVADLDASACAGSGSAASASRHGAFAARRCVRRGARRRAIFAAAGSADRPGPRQQAASTAATSTSFPRRPESPRPRPGRWPHRPTAAAEDAQPPSQPDQRQGNRQELQRHQGQGGQSLKLLGKLWCRRLACISGQGRDSAPPQLRAAGHCATKVVTAAAPPRIESLRPAVRRRCGLRLRPRPRG